MHPFRGAFCGTLGVVAAVGVVYFGFRITQLAIELVPIVRYVLSGEDSDDRCQPIGCDSGIHLPGCKYEERDSASVH